MLLKLKIKNIFFQFFIFVTFPTNNISFKNHFLKLIIPGLEL